jgi:hypothetical protein
LPIRRIVSKVLVAELDDANRRRNRSVRMCLYSRQPDVHREEARNDMVFETLRGARGIAIIVVSKLKEESLLRHDWHVVFLLMFLGIPEPEKAKVSARLSPLRNGCQE